VGAALLTASGEVFTGCNVENASYGLTLCAERVAVFKAVSQGNTDFVALAIAGGSATAPAAPCGACRQVLAEFGKPDMSVWFAGLANGPITTTTLAELLPHSFALSPEK
jgi:cytidine deaminase